MAEAELDEGSRDPSDNQVRPVKRSRTGCLTCRTRRRKCDEERPVCQNCKVKGLDCRYAATFQFLVKNNYTPVTENNVKYVNVKFVAEGDNVSQDASREQRLVELSGNNLALATMELAATIRAQTDMMHANDELVSRGTELQSSTSHTPSSNRYEFALNGLLALSGTEPPFVPAIHQLDPPEATCRQDSSTSNADALPIDTESSRGEVQPQHGWQTGSPSQTRMSEELDRGIAVADYAVFGGNSTDIVANQHAPQSADDERTVNLDLNTTAFANPTWSTSSGVIPTCIELELIQRYRYNIAPWLDMCNASHPFGVVVLIASTASNKVRDCVLNLAWTTENKIRIDTDTTDSDELGSSGHEPQVLVPRVFRLLQEVAIDLTNFWESKEAIQNGQEILAILLPQLNDATPFAQAAYWLVVRLLLGCALVAATPFRLPLPFLAHSRLPSTPGNDLTEVTQNAIALCVDSVMFSQGDDDRWLQQRYGLVRVEVWKTLLHGLGSWYRSRPQEFQPIIELYPKDGIKNDHDFPTIIFTSGAALLANQLYHTAMMLLLQHKPRFDARTGSGSTSMSILWHLHRICGIAINNDDPATWDTCLVASIIVAARNATHKSQQSAVVSALQNVQRLTGWSVFRHLEELSCE